MQQDGAQQEAGRNTAGRPGLLALGLEPLSSGQQVGSAVGKCPSDWRLKKALSVCTVRTDGGSKTGER